MSLTKESRQFLRDLRTLRASYGCCGRFCSDCVPDKGPYPNVIYYHYSDHCPTKRYPDSTDITEIPHLHATANPAVQYYMDDYYTIKCLETLLKAGEDPEVIYVRDYSLIRSFLCHAKCLVSKIRPDGYLRCSCKVCKAFARVVDLLDKSLLAVCNREDLSKAVITLSGTMSSELSKAAMETKTKDEMIALLRERPDEVLSLLNSAHCDLTGKPCRQQVLYTASNHMVTCLCRVCSAYSVLSSAYGVIQREKKGK